MPKSALEHLLTLISFKTNCCKYIVSQYRIEERSEHTVVSCISEEKDELYTAVYRSLNVVTTNVCLLQQD